MSVILIADDSTTARHIIRRCVEISRCGDTVLEASDGQQALDILRRHHVDLVLTDLNMPILDGKRLLMHIKSNPRLNSIIVVVISSLGNPALENELKELGADGVVPKPVSPATIQLILAKLSGTEDKA